MKITKEAPAPPAARPIGPRQREYEKQKLEKIMRKKAQIQGCIDLYVKINFLIAGITLWKMDWTRIVSVDMPLFQVVGTTIFLVIAYMELKPKFVNRQESKPKSKKSGKSAIEEEGLKLIED